MCNAAFCMLAMHPAHGFRVTFAQRQSIFTRPSRPGTCRQERVLPLWREVETAFLASMRGGGAEEGRSGKTVSGSFRFGFSETTGTRPYRFISGT